MPTNFTPKDPANPYADYTIGQLWPFLSGYPLPAIPARSGNTPTSASACSGELLARRAGTDYETLVKARVIGPLGMASTTITLTPDEQARLAVGHDSSLTRKVANWDMATLAGAGALRSTANDLMTFLAAAMGLRRHAAEAGHGLPLSPSAGRRGTPNLSQALGWELLSTSTGEIVQHGGGTGGYHTLIAFRPRTRTGVVVLTNAETVAGADDIGMHILAGSPVLTLQPPPPPRSERRAMPVAPEVLDRYVGRYQMSPEFFITVTRDADHLFAQLTGQAAFEIFPEAPAAFFWKVVDAQVTFEVGPDGHATRLTLHQNGRDLPGVRVP